jgi:uncharacterized protein YuzE
MRHNYLQITYRKGKALSAYLYLSRKPNTQSTRTQKIKDGIIVDFDEKNNPIGIEITSPSMVSASEINALLERLHINSIPEEDLLPLKAA